MLTIKELYDNEPKLQRVLTPVYWDAYSKSDRNLKPGDTFHISYFTFHKSAEGQMLAGYEVTDTTWGDYVGSDISRSNCRRLREDYPDVFITTVGDFTSEALMIPADLRLTEDAAAFGLGYALRGLADYPVYDDEDVFKIAEEVLLEAIEDGGWLIHDLRKELLDQLSFLRDFELTDQIIRDMVISFMHYYGAAELYMETATDLVFPEDAFIEWVRPILAYLVTTKKG